MQNDTASTYKLQGNQFFKAKDYKNAIQCYTQAINMNPMDATYFANRAACYFGLKRYDKCIQDCNDAIDLDPNFVKAWVRKGKSLCYLGRFDEARQSLQKARQLDPSDSSLAQEINQLAQLASLFENADASLRRGNYRAAVEGFKQVLTICPELAQAKIKAIEALAKSGDTKTAIDLSNRYASEFVENTDYLYARGLALCYDGKSNAAKKAWNEAMRIDPYNMKCKNAMQAMTQQEEAKEKGNAAFKSGDYQSALRFYTTGIELDPHNKNYVSTLFANRAAVYLKARKYTEAIEDCNKAIQINPNYAKAYLRRGEAKKALGNHQEAARDLNMANQLDPSLGAGQGTRTQFRSRNRAPNPEVKRDPKKDYYNILGIEKTANEDAIKKAYRKLALKWHPDKNNQSEEKRLDAEKKFKEINEAYSILSDPEKRKQYDLGGDLNGGNGGAGFEEYTSNIDPNIIFQTFFGGKNPFSSFGNDDGDSFGGLGGFGGFPGGGFGRGGAGNVFQTFTMGGPQGGKTFSFKSSRVN